jgi:hypothetical protein
MDVTQQVVVQVVPEMDLHQLQMEQVLTVHQALMVLLFPLSLAQLTAVAVVVEIDIQLHRLEQRVQVDQVVLVVVVLVMLKAMEVQQVILVEAVAVEEVTVLTTVHQMPEVVARDLADL